MGSKKMRKWGARGASLPEYAIVLGIMALVAVGIRTTLWEAGREESTKQESCISQIPPPAYSPDGSGCEIPAVSTTTTVPGGTTTTTVPVTIPAPTRPEAPTNLVIRPTYDQNGQHFLDVEFTPPSNSAVVPISTYQYSTNGTNGGGEGERKWKTRSSGTTETVLRIDLRTETFNTGLSGSTDYDVAIRAVSTQGAQGKRSAVWRASTAKALMRCSANGVSPVDYCPQNFSTYVESGTLYGSHKLAADDTIKVATAIIPVPTSINMFSVGGGGVGGSNGGGGGGGGGTFAANVTTVGVADPINNPASYLVLAGSGGVAGTGSTRGGSGVLSFFAGMDYAAYGGGGGASRDGAAATPPCGSPETQSCPTSTFSSRGAWDATGGQWSSLVTPNIGSGGGGANTTTGFRRARGNGRSGQGNNGGFGCLVGTDTDCLGEGGGGGGGGRSGVGTGGNGTATIRGGTGGGGLPIDREDGITPLLYGSGGGGGKTSNGTAGLGGNCLLTNVEGCVGGSSRPNLRISGMDGRGGGGAGGSGGTNGSAAGRGGGGVVLFRYALTNQQILPSGT